MTRPLGPAASIDTLKKDAKRWLKALRARDADALDRLARAWPEAPAAPALRDVQYALAREYGCDSWIGLTHTVENRAARIAGDLAAAFNNRDEAALQRLNDHYQRAFTFDDLWAEIWRRLYPFRQRAFRGGPQQITLEEARIVVAQDAGYSSWVAFTQVSTASGDQRTARRVPPFVINEQERGIAPLRRLTDPEWDELIAVMKDRRLVGLRANGLMTDSVLGRLAALDHVTRLALGGSREMSDDGVLQLARMPQLEALELSEYPGGRLTDRGLAVLAALPNLRSFEMTWQAGISDAGVSHLARCERLEQVDLMGSPTGDGAIAALEGKPALRSFKTGRLVTDAGLRRLQNFPLLKADGSEARLLIDGPFTNAGLAGLAGLAGVVDLDLFWHVTGLTSDGFAHLAQLPNLQSLGADGRLSDNSAMRHFAAIPRLRNLRCQEAVADDAGWEALSRSRTLEGLWGRVCQHFGSRGFVALSKMPALRRLGIGCGNVDDGALSTLPSFPSLRELTPIDVTDEGFVHIGKCARLERLTCMYCRETTDVATGHIVNLAITYYYAGLTKITDRSLERLGRMTTLEQVEFCECNGITDAGLPFLSALPRLQQVEISECPGITLEGTRVFSPNVRVRYAT